MSSEHLLHSGEFPVVGPNFGAGDLTVIRPQAGYSTIQTKQGFGKPDNLPTSDSIRTQVSENSGPNRTVKVWREYRDLEPARENGRNTIRSAVGNLDNLCRRPKEGPVV